MDGLELAHRIHADPALRATHLLLLAPVGSSVAPARLDECGIEFHLTKPVRSEEVCRCLLAMATAGAGTGTRAPCRPAPTPARRALNARVLVAEDHPVNPQASREMLRMLGVDADLVDNGRAAVDAVSREHYDLVLMDWRMPEMDGLEAARAIRSLERERGVSRPVCIIATTANALHGDRERCLEAGMNDYLSKPFRLENLRATLERWLPQDTRGDLGRACPEAQRVMEPGEPPRAESPAETETIDALDPRALGDLLALSPDGSFLARLTECYLATSLEDLDALRAAVSAQNPEAIRARAHSLKSSSGNVAALGLAGLCARLEKAARSGEIGDAPDTLDCIASEHARVVQALQLELQRAA
jgi:CheY-like chemotaxis protein/HPt (histidine-containing phosphotransfer) domain-containing protein